MKKRLLALMFVLVMLLASCKNTVEPEAQPETPDVSETSITSEASSAPEEPAEQSSSEATIIAPQTEMTYLEAHKFYEEEGSYSNLLRAIEKNGNIFLVWNSQSPDGENRGYLEGISVADGKQGFGTLYDDTYLYAYPTNYTMKLPDGTELKEDDTQYTILGAKNFYFPAVDYSKMIPYNVLEKLSEGLTEDYQKEFPTGTPYAPRYDANLETQKLAYVCRSEGIYISDFEGEVQNLVLENSRLAELMNDVEMAKDRDCYYDRPLISNGKLIASITISGGGVGDDAPSGISILDIETGEINDYIDAQSFLSTGPSHFMYDKIQFLNAHSGGMSVIDLETGAQEDYSFNFHESLTYDYKTYFALEDEIVKYYTLDNPDDKKDFFVFEEFIPNGVISIRDVTEHYVLIEQSDAEGIFEGMYIVRWN